MRRRVALTGALATAAIAVATVSYVTMTIHSKATERPTAQGSAPAGLVALIERDAPVDDPYAFVFCSGALIAPDRVLTASHCLTDHDRVDVLVNPDSVCHPDPIGGERLMVLGWRPRRPGSDLAVVRLAGQAAAPPLVLSAGHEGTLTAWGWGASRDGTPPCAATPKPLWATESDDCAAAGVALAPDAWCGLPAAGLNTCRGDSGGPVVDGAGRVVAVVSGGLDCGPDSPGSYVEVQPAHQ